jgi:hypothetical protein
MTYARKSAAPLPAVLNTDGTGNRNITPDCFPSAFLCHSPVFSRDDSRTYFIGQWWVGE